MKKIKDVKKDKATMRALHEMTQREMKNRGLFEKRKPAA